MGWWLGVGVEFLFNLVVLTMLLWLGGWLLVTVAVSVPVGWELGGVISKARMARRERR